MISKYVITILKNLSETDCLVVPAFLYIWFVWDSPSMHESNQNDLTLNEVNIYFMANCTYILKFEQSDWTTINALIYMLQRLIRHELLQLL